jgi:hypothetical protein
MKYEQFEKLIKNLEKTMERSRQIHDLGIDLLDYDEIYHEVIGSLMLSTFKFEGKDWVDWYLYERPSFGDKEPLKAFDENDNEICHNIQSLWDTVKDYINEKNN